MGCMETLRLQAKETRSESDAGVNQTPGGPQRSDPQQGRPSPGSGPAPVKWAHRSLPSGAGEGSVSSRGTTLGASLPATPAPGRRSFPALGPAA